MREGEGGSGAGDAEVEFRGIRFIVDVCGGKKTMVVLVGFKGVLDLCATVFGEGEDVPDSPASLAARFYAMETERDDASIAGSKRRSEEQGPAKKRKTRKQDTESDEKGGGSDA